MTSVFIREQKRYQLSELVTLFKSTLEETTSIIRKLKEVGIVKVIKLTKEQLDLEEFFEEDLVLTDEVSFENNLYYVFKFVGIVIISDLIINCYPKYILSTEKPVREFKQILKVLEKYFNRKQEIKLFENDSFISSNSRLALYLFLMEDYFENGIYTEDQVVYETNGTGEIDWNRTVNQNSVFISNNQPNYYELITRKRQNNESNYVKKIHEIILTKISHELEETKLLDLFELTEINLSDRELSEFGDIDLIIYNLEKKLNEQFNTRKRLVILSLIAYLNQEIRVNEINSLTLYGTNSFNLVWEDVCKVILDDQLNTPLQFLNLPDTLNESFNNNDTLREIIERPFWVYTENFADKTFIPDIISVGKYKKNYYFIIFDAKYYTAVLEPGIKPRRQPGIESVSKQFFYQLAFKSFISSHQFDLVGNFFILPTEGIEVINKRQVRMSIMNELDLEEIEVRLIPAEIAFDYYLNDKKVELNFLGI